MDSKIKLKIVSISVLILFLSISFGVNNGMSAINTQKMYKGEIVSFDLKDTDIVEVFKIFSDVSGFKLVASKDVKGKVSFKIKDVPWDQALDIILKSAGLQATVNGDVINIAPLKRSQAQKGGLKETIVPPQKDRSIKTKRIFINYLEAKEIKQLLDPLLSDAGRVIINSETNSVLINDTKAKIDEIGEFIRNLDERYPQILIESTIVQTALRDFTRELGVIWGNNYATTSGDSFADDNMSEAQDKNRSSIINIAVGAVASVEDVDAKLSALEVKGKGKIISSSDVLTFNNDPAVIEQLFPIPFVSSLATGTKKQFVNATLTLNVTPRLTDNDKILMNIRLTDNRPLFINGRQTVITNKASARVIADNGETVVIKGVYNENNTTVSCFSSVPFVGCFGDDEEVKAGQVKEIVVFITPRIKVREKFNLTITN